MDQAFQNCVSRLGPEPTPLQYEGIKAMHYAWNSTKESFVSYWPQGMGTTAMMAMYLAVELELGVVPRNVLIIVSTQRELSTIFQDLRLSFPSLTKGVMGVHLYGIQAQPRAKLTEALLEALPTFSLDLVKVVVGYSDVGHCDIKFQIPSAVGHTEPPHDLIICDLLQASSVFYESYLADMRRSGALLFLFFWDRHRIQPSGLWLPELVVSDTAEWRRASDRYVVKYSHHAGAVHESEVRLREEDYDYEAQRHRSLLNCLNVA
jgi:hypothetical protein